MGWGRTAINVGVGYIGLVDYASKYMYVSIFIGIFKTQGPFIMCDPRPARAHAQSGPAEMSLCCGLLVLMLSAVFPLPG